MTLELSGNFVIMTNAQDTPDRWRPRIRISSLLLLTAVAGTATMWYLDHRELAPLRVELEALRIEAEASKADADGLRLSLGEHIRETTLLRTVIGMAIERGEIKRADEIVRTGHYDFMSEKEEHRLWLEENGGTGTRVRQERE